MLTGVAEIDGEELIELADFSIVRGTNMMIFGNAGTGKTEIGEQRADAAALKGIVGGYIYLNLSVLEAPDLMGLAYRLDSVSDAPAKEGEAHPLDKDVGGKKAVRVKMAYAIPEKFPYLGEGMPMSLVCDELDKARPELQNPMLELFQFRSINGTKLNIKSVYATGNLPDENAFSQPVSHALMNRCKVYRFNSSYEPWSKWAVENNINPLVVGFLSRNQNFLLKPPPSGDDTAYVHPSPRSWVAAAKDLDGSADSSVEFQTRLVAGNVGTGAAAQFRVWLDHHRHIEPHLDALIKDGKRPDRDVMSSLERQFVFGIAGVNAIVEACNRADAAKKGEEAEAKKRVLRTVDNVMGWMETIQTDYAIGAVKSVLTMDLITKHKLMDIKSFMTVFIEIRKAWGRG